jgi:hypothetical protein
MLYTALKVAITAVLVVAIAEVGKRSSAVGAVLASLPLTSLLAFIWLYGETGDAAKVANLAQSIFWYVLPSLVLFLALPVLIANGVGFWSSLAVSCALTFVAYLAMGWVLARFGIVL